MQSRNKKIVLLGLLTIFLVGGSFVLPQLTQAQTPTPGSTEGSTSPSTTTTFQSVTGGDATKIDQLQRGWARIYPGKNFSEEAFNALSETDKQKLVSTGETATKSVATLFKEFVVGSFADTVMLVIGHVASFLLFLLSRLLWLAAALLEWTLSIQQFTKVGVVESGWAVCRGLCNMFFALILLIMAFDTVLHLNKFPVKTILPKLVIAILLINFSLVIAGVVVDFSQVMTNYFVSGASGNSNISNQLMTGFNIQKAVQDPATTGAITGASRMAQLFGVILSFFFAIILCLIATFAVGAGAIFMIIRMVYIWILLIFSPFAWLSFAAGNKGTEGMNFSGWWSQFIKWTMFAPIYTFFIYLAVMIASQGTMLDQISNSNAAALNSELTGVSAFLGGGLRYIIQYCIIVIILLLGLYYAQKSGMAGAKAVVGFGGKLAKGTGKFLGDKTQNWLAKGAKMEGTTRFGKAWATLRRGSAYLAPDVMKEAFKRKSEQRKREARTVAYGAAHDFVNRYVTPSMFRLKRGEKTDYKERAAREMRAEELKKVQGNNANELVAGFIRAQKAGNGDLAAAYFQKLTAQNDQNELFKHLNRTQGTKYNMDAEGFTDFIDKEMKPLLRGEQAAYRFGHDMGRIMEDNGQWIGRPFDVDVNKKTGESTYFIRESGGKSWSTMNREERKAVGDAARGAAFYEWRKQDPQKQANTTGRFSYIHENYEADPDNPQDGGLTKAGEDRIVALEATQSNRIHAHSRAILIFNHGDRVKELNRGVYNNLTKLYKEAVTGMDNDQIRDYLDRQTDGLPALPNDPNREAAYEMLKGLRDEAQRDATKKAEEETEKEAEKARKRGQAQQPPSQPSQPQQPPQQQESPIINPRTGRPFER